MSHVEPNLANSTHFDFTANKGFWPMMIFKLIIGQKLISKIIIIGIILLLSITSISFWFNNDNTQKQQQDLREQLHKYQQLYQQQLAFNKQLVINQQQADFHAQMEADEELVEFPTQLTADSTNLKIPGLLSEKEAIDTAMISDKQRLSLPLSASVETSLFRMIPNDSPVHYQRVSSPFGGRVHPISGKKSHHLGIDLTCPLGTPIYATADGVVETTRPSQQGYGNMIKVRHAFGFMTLYAHLHQFAVSQGQFIEKGDRIGFCGSSGNSTGSHLHYEVRFIGKALNPQDFMQWQPNHMAYLFTQQQQVPWASLMEQLTNTIHLQTFLAINQTNYPSSPSSKIIKQRSQGLDQFGLTEDNWQTVKER